ncbi:MAG TPA: DUF1156 domain-containing protein, partial [Fimbriimonadaceae bacterium]|nr:DUF1156 domain-containing protein [Fimbriimonadaceae bacterium]
MTKVVPHSLKDVPALIEKVLPVQLLSIEAYKEQMAVQSKTLIALGSYWKGRKPLILNRACVLGCLLPATGDLAKDLEVFELLMGMDDLSMRKRLGLGPDEPLPASAYKQLVDQAKRPEELGETLHVHAWPLVNSHLGTDATSFPELVEQLGIMRFGHRPRVADTFCGSGQIPFEAARLGCDVFASDLNPIACMLTWGAFHIVGGSPDARQQLVAEQQALFERIQSDTDALAIETDGNGWRIKALLYCLEVTCPETGWRVPLLSTLVLSKSRSVIAELVPNRQTQRYEIRVRIGVSDHELADAANGTVRSGGRGQDPYLIHILDGREHRTRVSSLRGDYRMPDGSQGSALRRWEKEDFKPRPEDVFQERLYAIQWSRPKPGGRGEESEFRAVTDDDLAREAVVERFVAEHL